ncbi:hypothetical protein ACI65C_003798 [Semiaphis heraclei]
MDLMECYVSTSRIALQAKSIDPLSWQKLHTLLPMLHEHLSCRVCHKLLDRLNPYLDGYACTVCVNNQINENTSSTILHCYKKLCAYIHSTPLYKVMCTRVEDKQLVELITEVIGVSRSVNGYSGMVNSTVNKQDTKEENNEDDITLISSLDIQLPTENLTSEDLINLQRFDEQPQKHRIQNQSAINVIPKKKKNERRWGCRSVNDYSGMINSTVNKQDITGENNEDDITLISTSDIQLPIENLTPEDIINLQIFDEQPQKHRIQNQSKNESRWGCRSVNDYSGMVNSTVNKQDITEENNEDNITLISTSDIQLPIENLTSEDLIDLFRFDEQPQKHRIQNQPVINNIPKKKKNERRWGCQCGNATSNPGTQTCFGQRCPCYAEQKPCDQCKCKGCRNPKQKRSNNDDNLEIDKVRRKPVTLELVSSFKPSHQKNEPSFNSYTDYDMLQSSSHTQNYDQDETEDRLGLLNSIFYSP